MQSRPTLLLVLLPAAALAAAGCRSPGWHAHHADRRAADLTARYRERATGVRAPIPIERPSDTLRRRLLAEQGLAGAAAGADAPAAPTGAVLRLTLVDALKVGVRNSRDYQDAKESVFSAALKLDLEQDAFRHSLAGLLSGTYTDDRTADPHTRGIAGRGEAELGQKLRTGAEMSLKLAVDVVKLLTLDRDSAMGLMADATVTVPLWRGAGARIAGEPLTQAEQDLLYAIWEFEAFRQAFAVRTASAYYGVLDRLQQVRNAGDSHERLRLARERAARLAEAGRTPDIQVGQARQDELRARERLVGAQQSYERELDQFKQALGLPVDARLELDPAELVRLGETALPSASADAPAAPGSGTWRGLDAGRAVREGLERRFDLRQARGALDDARRAVAVAADALRTGVRLEAKGSAGEGRSLKTADQPDGRIRPSSGNYGATLAFDWPWRRTAERNAYRESLLALDRAQRALEDAEDTAKREIRDGFRALRQARESYGIQQQAVEVARRRVEGSELLQQAGRAEIRDLLEAEDAFVSARNAATSALVAYRVAELSLQRDVAALAVNEEGLWNELQPAPVP